MKREASIESYVWAISDGCLEVSKIDLVSDLKLVSHKNQISNTSSFKFLFFGQDLSAFSIKYPCEHYEEKVLKSVVIRDVFGQWQKEIGILILLYVGPH